jgi:hypothetical protein
MKLGVMAAEGDVATNSGSDWQYKNLMQIPVYNDQLFDIKSCGEYN